MPITQAHVWTFFWLHIGVILVVTAYFAVAVTLLPNAMARAAARFSRRSWLAAVIGLLVSGPIVLAGVILASMGPPLAGIGVILLLGWLFAGLIGSGGIALALGRSNDGQHSSVAAIRGGLMITLTWALPLVGWLFVLPLTIATGVGCLILGMIPLKGAAAPVNQAAPAGSSGDGDLSFADRETLAH